MPIARGDHRSLDTDLSSACFIPTQDDHRGRRPSGSSVGYNDNRRALRHQHRIPYQRQGSSPLQELAQQFDQLTPPPLATSRRPSTPEYYPEAHVSSPLQYRSQPSPRHNDYNHLNQAEGQYRDVQLGEASRHTIQRAESPLPNTAVSVMRRQAASCFQPGLM